MSILTKKICLIGDFGVGKTSLIRQFVERQFSDQYLSTVGVKISKKQRAVVQADQSRTVQLLIWDIEGQTKFKTVSESYFQGAAGAIIVGDVSRSETVAQLSEYWQRFWQINPKSLIAIALNKADLLEAERMDYLVQSLAIESERVLGKYPTSAKTGANVDQMFETLVNKLAFS
jgi:small GTP-binding protein